METTLGTIHTTTPFKSLTREEENILEMYSRGESYEVIQENLLIEHGQDYSVKKLGKKMGEIKRKMNCETQFQMGYLYKRRQVFTQVEQISAYYENKLKLAKEEKYEEGYETGCQQVAKYLTGSDLNKGINMGIVFSTLFWLAIIGILSQYVL